MLKSFAKLWKDEDGPTSVEYALMLVLVSIVAIAAWQLLGNNVSARATEAAGAVGTAGTGGGTGS